MLKKQLQGQGQGKWGESLVKKKKIQKYKLSVIRKIKSEDLMYNMVKIVDDTHKKVKM